MAAGRPERRPRHSRGSAGTPRADRPDRPRDARAATANTGRGKRAKPAPHTGCSYLINCKKKTYGGPSIVRLVIRCPELWEQMRPSRVGPRMLPHSVDPALGCRPPHGRPPLPDRAIPRSLAFLKHSPRRYQQRSFRTHSPRRECNLHAKSAPRTKRILRTAPALAAKMGTLDMERLGRSKNAPPVRVDSVPSAVGHRKAHGTPPQRIALLGDASCPCVSTT